MPCAFSCLLSVPSHLVTSLLFQLLHLCLPRYPPCLSPYLFSRCLQSCADLLFYVVCVCVMSARTAVLCLPACLPVFPPRGGFCSFLFHFIIKRKTILPATWVLASSLLTHPDKSRLYVKSFSLNVLTWIAFIWFCFVYSEKRHMIVFNHPNCSTTCNILNQHLEVINTILRQLLYSILCILLTFL